MRPGRASDGQRIDLMTEHHVFVETNWVVARVAPTLFYNSAAGELLERARRGELHLHVPALSLSEAHKVVELSALYDAAGVWVYGDFLLENPARPESWPRA